MHRFDHKNEKGITIFYKMVEKFLSKTVNERFFSKSTQYFDNEVKIKTGIMFLFYIYETST